MADPTRHEIAWKQVLRILGDGEKHTGREIADKMHLKGLRERRVAHGAIQHLKRRKLISRVKIGLRYGWRKK